VKNTTKYQYPILFNIFIQRSNNDFKICKSVSYSGDWKGWPCKRIRPSTIYRGWV